ncbi:MAG: radical SAM protein [Pseudomonadales bacterium]|nr:radical SAM protein [Pseudomonadales bacterium]
MIKKRAIKEIVDLHSSSRENKPLGTVLRLSRWAYPITALGPGRRLAMWVSGCSIGCPGCITPELQPETSGKPISTERLLARLDRLPDDLTGLTLTGGEPFQQASVLAEWLGQVKQRKPHWNILCFSGYTFTAIQQLGSGARDLLEVIDLLVAGPYRVSQLSGEKSVAIVPSISTRHPLLASANQTLHCLTQEGRAMEIACRRMPVNQANLGLSGDGQGMLIGIVTPSARTEIHTRLGGPVEES